MSTNEKGYAVNVAPLTNDVEVDFNVYNEDVQNQHPFSPDIPEDKFGLSCSTDSGIDIGTKSIENDWPKPQEIPSTLLPVVKFDEALLPESLRAWVSDIANRMQCPIDFPAVGAMVALSSVLGRKVCIRPKRRDDWTVTPNLWGGVVGRPGVMKSPALSEVLKPLARLAISANERNAEEILEFKTMQTLNELTGKNKLRDAKNPRKKGGYSQCRAANQRVTQ